MYITKVLLFMKTIKLIFLILFGVISNLTMNSQVTTDNFRDHMYDLDANYFEVVEKGDEFFQLNPTLAVDNTYGYKDFERWKLFWKNRIDSQDPVKSGTMRVAFDALQAFALEKSSYCFESSDEADWTYAGPKNMSTQHMGLITSLALDPNDDQIIYAGTNASGIFKTMNGGTTWTNVTDVFDLPGIGVQSITISESNPNEIYACLGLTTYGRGYGSGIIYSNDAGASWNQLDYLTPIESSDLAYGLVINPQDESQIYAIIEDKIFRHDNKGVDGGSFQWELIYEIDPSTNKRDFRDIIFAESDPNTLYITSDDLGANLPATNDGGSMVLQVTNPWGALSSITIQDISPPNANISDRIAIATTPAESGSLFCSYKTSGTQFNLAESSNPSSGAWATLLTETPTDNYGFRYGGIGWFRNELVISPTNRDHFYLGGFEVTQLHMDVTSICFVPPCSFLRHGNSSFAHVDCRALLIKDDGAGNDIIYNANDGGISKSVDGSMTWSNINGEGLNCTQFFGLTTHQLAPGLLAGGCQDNSLILRDLNGTWRKTAGGDMGNVTSSFDGLKSYAAQWPGTVNLTNSCRSWSTQLPSCSDFTINLPSMMEIQKNFEFEYDDNGLLYSGDYDVWTYDETSGSGWTQISDFQSLGARECQALEKVRLTSDPNVIYASFYGPTYNQDYANCGAIPCSDPGGCGPCPSGDCAAFKMFKTINGGVSWEDITKGLKVEWAGITDIAVDPIDPHRVWVSMSSFANAHEKNRVFYSEDTRLITSTIGNWTDVSIGLPNMPSSAIEYLEGSDDVLFLGNDVGVFIFDKSTQSWSCFSDGMPFAIVSDLEVNYCEQKLYVSTFGRGIWETPLPNYTEKVWMVDQDEEIDRLIFSASDIVVTNNSVLTIEANAELLMNVGKSITVEKGSKIIIEGGIITNQCGEFWKGIILEGSAGLSQLNPLNRGTLIMNGGTIEYARNAVQLVGEHPSGGLDWTKTGGVVGIDGATFRNNWRSFEFMSYDIGGNNLSKITNSFFLTDINYPDKDLGPYAHVTMYDIQGVDFENNLFDNLDWEEFDFDRRGSGLVLLDASMRVGPVCGFFDPFCDDFSRKNTFNNLYAGVISLEGTSNRKTTIDQNSFSNCIYGVRIAGTNTKSDVTRNTFQISNADGSSGDSGTRIWDFGIYSDGVSGSKFEDNDFTSFSSTGAFLSTGIFKKNGDVLGSEVFLNRFTDLSIGLQTSQNNLGLKYDCNGFNIGSNSIVGHHHSSGLIANQGNCLSPFQFSKMANKWTGVCDVLNSKYQQYRNPGTNLFEYDSYELEGYMPSTCAFDLSTGENCTGQNEPIEQCETSLVATPIETVKGKYFVLAEQKSLLDNQVDAGDSDALLDVITNGSGGQVKNELLAVSPYLSDKVLIEYLWSNPSNGHLKQVYLANSPLSQKVFFWLESDNIPNGILNQIQNAQTGERPLDQIEKEISVVNLSKNIELARMTRRFLDSAWVDSVWIDTAVFYLELDGSSEASCALVPIEIKRNPVKADQHLTSIRIEGEDIKKYEVPGDKKAENILSFCDFHELLMQVKQRPGGYYSLTYSEKNDLNTIAQKGDVGVRANAQAILDFLKNDFPYLGGEDILGPGKSLNIDVPDKEITIEKKEIRTNPNPTSGLLNILSNVELESGEIRIYSIDGRLVDKMNIIGTTKTIDLQSQPEGMYVVQILEYGVIIKYDKIIIRK
ncbi:MAG: hypothetical protein ACI9J3_000942 [Parvicellaceae bacterium]